MRFDFHFPRALHAFALFAALVLSGSSLFAQAYPTAVGLTTTRSDPYYFTGRISSDFAADSFQATGTIIRPYSVITCAHILYDEAYGWSYNLSFERALHGNSYLKIAYPNSKVVLGGYQDKANTYGGSSIRAFARDLGGLRFRNQVAGGGYAGWQANPSLLLDSTYNMSLGYGAESYNGRYLLRSAPSQAYVPYRGAYYENTSYFIEAGMSGGPVFAQPGGVWYVVAVNVSGFPGGSGVRAFNQTAATFIQTYLP